MIELRAYASFEPLGISGSRPVVGSGAALIVELDVSPSDMMCELDGGTFNIQPTDGRVAILRIT